MEEVIVRLDEEISDFKRYFNNNNRCVLSAPYGEGKSVFLNEFVQSQVEEYDFITVYPTNYQICENRDILEYIKRDILFGLIALDETILNGFDSTKLGVIKKTILESKEDLIGSIPDINASVCGVGVTLSPGKIINTLSQIWESCSKHSSVEGNPYKEYLVSFNDERGGIYELDAITNLICSIVNARQETGRKMVLVIEDLDRIDPGQIFRILNVLSAHMTYSNGYDDGRKNKFNFDKILLLCDYNNIKKIYHHLYGDETDFNGYISKFSSVGPYDYSIRKKMAKHIGSIIDVFVKDTLISNVLAEEIILSTHADDGAIVENLRNIKERIKFASSQFEIATIPVKVKKEHLAYMENKDQAKSTFNELYVTTDKPLLVFMAICKAFALSSRDVMEKVMKTPRAYDSVNHIAELCGLIMIPVIPHLQPVLDYDFTFRLNGAGASRGNELILSSDGEILEMVKQQPYSNDILNYKSEEMLDSIAKFEQYLY